ncbi:MAG: hypothetical protein K2H92_08750 [Bacteroidaceae bacterium]|nr:hypothetical protein [Bacteroidaceae bacterium]
MSPTSTHRSPRHRSVGVGDSDLEAVDARHIRAPYDSLSENPKEAFTQTETLKQSQTKTN